MESLIEEFREEGKAPDVKFTCIFPYMVNTGLCKKPKIRFVYIFTSSFFLVLKKKCLF